MSPLFSARLDLLRAVSALLVLFSHLRVQCFAARDEFQHPSLWLNGMAFIAGLGWPSVMVFFALSGYLIGGRWVQSARTRDDVVKYAIARLTRLWIVLIPVLLICLLLASLSQALGRIDTGDIPYDTRAFLQALFFLNIRGEEPYFGGNVPLWSLNYEFWYYLAFPILLATCLTQSWLRRLCGALSLVVIVGIVGRTVSVLFLAWLAGAAIVLLPRARFPAAVGWLVLLAGMVASRIDPLNRLWTGPIIGIGTALLIWAWRDTLAPHRGLTLFDRLGVSMAKWSYSLYLFHYPVLIFGGWWLFGTTHSLALQPDLSGWAVFVLLGLAALGCSYLLYWLCERHTPRIRRWLEGLWFRRFAVPAGR